jgi:LacI family transcriptional regulator
LLVVERGMVKGEELGARLIADKRVDGFLFVNFTALRPTLEVLLEAGLPAATCLSNDNPAGIPWAMADNAGAMEQAVDYLMARGHRKIGFLGGPTDHCDAISRRAGFLRAMESRGQTSAESIVVPGNWHRSHLPEMCDRALQVGASAIVCSNDEQALALWDLAEVRGLRVPGDLSIIGVDDFGPAAERGLTTLSNPLEAVGQAGAEALLATIAGNAEPQAQSTVPVQLVERHSVAPRSQAI